LVCQVAVESLDTGNDRSEDLNGLEGNIENPLSRGFSARSDTDADTDSDSGSDSGTGGNEPCA
jgi:hypothetical protein